MTQVTQSENNIEHRIGIMLIQTALDFKREHQLNGFKEITNHFAEPFRDEVLKRLRAETPDATFIADTIAFYDYGDNLPEPYEHESEIPHHAWIRYDDRLYDLQAPHGVDHWSKLPFYIEQAARRNK